MNSQEKRSKMLIPNSFQTPNLIVDDALPYLQGSECKIILFLIRKTFGWQKKRDKLSLSQFMKHTGLSRHSVIDALEFLCTINLILKYPSAKGFTNSYELNLDWNFEQNESSLKNRPVKVGSAKSAPVQKVHQGSAKIAPKVVQKLHLQKPNKPTIKNQHHNGDNGKLDSDTYKEKVRVWFKDNADMLKKEYFQLWQETYPNINIPNTINKAYTWLLSNPDKQRSKFIRYLNGWLGKTQQDYEKTHTN